MHRLMSSEISLFVLRFRDYIRVKYGVELELKPIINERGFPMEALFIDENHPKFDVVLAECKEFLKDPFSPRYEQASWQNGDTQTEMPKMKFDFAALQHKGKLTLFLTALCVIIYLLQNLGFEDLIFQLFHYPADSSESGELWRYFSHSWVHLSLWHLLFNLAWWWIFAGLIERHFGSLKLLQLYALSAVISGMVQNYFSGPAFFGLSGVVYAVLGYAFMMDKLRLQKEQDKFNLPQGFFNMLIIGIALGFISPFFGVYMGNAAHISGLLTGMFLAYIDRTFSTRNFYRQTK